MFSFKIPSLSTVKLVIIGLIALAITGLCIGGYAYVKSLQNEVSRLNVSLAAQVQLSQSLEKTIVSMEKQDAINRNALGVLEQANRADWESWSVQLNALTTSNETETSDEIAARLDRANRAANRLLERATTN
jgi:predicted transcriptional regulator